MLTIGAGANVRIRTGGFEGRIGLVEHIEAKSEAFRGWNYSVLVFQNEAMVSENSEYYCFSRDELELMAEDAALIEVARHAETVASEDARRRYVTYSLDSSTYVVYDSVAEKDVCVCVEYESCDLPEARAEMIAEALNLDAARY